ncbi:GNAT family N-acetyltransferase [Virgibacillus profundi]|uniref:GNAT family N-acetyltransferase n=1 Tax=Virgibacillus profundi TaxID=2024555 RepID=A0A2A2IDC8_9BACI|nr:GNAT family N-acetyltransferase [Virgibacillus profundi]PAV29326.1 GNAT family N-acetyltransferase [Virgibacillus profundi]PXY53495.1 N-acetyltransferase [Virgibacillus profundi]
MFSIRKATFEDAETIAHIHVTSWKSTYSDLLDERDLSNITYENRKALWETVLRIRKKDQCTFVIHNEDKVVGFISGGPERTKRFHYDSEIHTIYLLDEYQKMGLGAILLKAFAEEMKSLGKKSILVWILKQNPSSRFYERYYAKPVGEEAISIGEGSYKETAYGWESIDELLRLMN